MYVDNELVIPDKFRVLTVVVGAVVSLTLVSLVPEPVLPAVSVRLTEAVMVPSVNNDRSTVLAPLTKPLTTIGVPPPLELKVTVAVVLLSMLASV